jgi:hypothetical protein
LLVDTRNSFFFSLLSSLFLLLFFRVSYQKMTMSKTSLGKQLSNLVQRGETSSALPRRASFLFDLKQAAEIDAATIYSIGLSGLAELIRIDPYFTSFRDNLFSTRFGFASAMLDRDVQTKEVCSLFSLLSLHLFCQTVSLILLALSSFVCGRLMRNLMPGFLTFFFMYHLIFYCPLHIKHWNI